jgi:hypothetical protein
MSLRINGTKVTLVECRPKTCKVKAVIGYFGFFVHRISQHREGDHWRANIRLLKVNAYVVLKVHITTTNWNC